MTGIPGSGKTEYVRELFIEKPLHVLSVDTYKVEFYEKYGFLSEEERVNLNNLAKCKFKAELIELMRTGDAIVVEYPFDSSWQEFFSIVSEQYGYKTIIVKFDKTDFEEIWNRRVARDSIMDNDIRPICLQASKFIKGKLFEPDDSLTEEGKLRFKRIYDSGERTCLGGDLILHK